MSLLVRTCHAHAVNPRLVIRDIFSEAEPSIRRIPTAAFYQHLAGTMNGLGKYAELFVSAMEKLTGRTNLRVLTMLPWQSLFPHNGQGMLARHRRWCPVCLHQQRLNSEVATWPLIWSLDTYSFCHRHLVPLEHCCPSCGKAQPFVPSYPDLGICSHCHRPLGCRHEPQEVSEFQHWIADALSGIVEQQSEKGFSPSLEVFHKFLVGQVEAHTEGNRAAFCRALGLNEFAISGCHQQLAIYPNDIALHWHMALAAYAEKDFGASRDHFRRVADLDPRCESDVQCFLKRIDDEWSPKPVK